MGNEKCLSRKLSSWEKIAIFLSFSQSVSIEFRCQCMVREGELKRENDIWSLDNIQKFDLASFRFLK